MKLVAWTSPLLLGMLLSGVQLEPAWSQTPAFPTRPVEMTVPFGVGNAADVTARYLAEGMAKSYDAMHRAYTAIFTRLGLKFRAVVADTGAIGGSASEEFHVLADSGEDAIAFSDGDSYAANMEMAVALPPAAPPSQGTRPPAEDRKYALAMPVIPSSRPLTSARVSAGTPK